MDNVYVLYGEEPFTIKQYVDAMMMHFDEYCISSYEDWADEIWTSARQIPIFSDKQLIIVKPKTISDDNFLQYCKNPSDSTVMIVVPEMVDKRVKAFKALKSLGVLKECKKFTEEQLQDFFVSQIRENGCEIKRDTYEYFIQKTGYYLDENVNMFSLQNYIQQFCTVSDGEITKADIDAFVIDTCTTKTFALSSLLLKRDKEALFSLANRFLNEKENVIAMLSLLLRTFRVGYKASLYSDRKESEIGKLLGVPAFQYKEALQYSPEQISTCMDNLQRGIRWIKTGGADERSAFILTLSNVLSCLES